MILIAYQTFYDKFDNNFNGKKSKLRQWAAVSCSSRDVLRSTSANVLLFAQMAVANLPDLTEKCRNGQVDEDGGLCRDSPGPFDELKDEEIKQRLEASCSGTSGSVRWFGGC